MFMKSLAGGLHSLDLICSVVLQSDWAYFQSSDLRVHALSTFLMENLEGKMQGHRTNTSSFLMEVVVL